MGKSPQDLLHTSVNSTKRVAALMSPVFIGDYNPSFRLNDCHLKKTINITFNGTDFDDLRDGPDKVAHKRFELLSNLVFKYFLLLETKFSPFNRILHFLTKRSNLYYFI